MKLLGELRIILYIYGLGLMTNDINSRDCPSNGSWTSSNEVNKFTYTAGADLQIYFTPNAFYSRNGIGRIGYLIKARMDQETKSQDNYAEVGSFQVTLTAPSENSSTIVLPEEV
jgi:hypothetical protein